MKMNNRCCKEKHHTEDERYSTVAASATLHCLVGCSIGEFLGLFIGVSLGFSVFWIIVLDTTLAYISGFLLTLIPLMKYKKMSLASAFKIIWLGEAISIGVMEFAMNTVDYLAGGMTVSSVWDKMFWIGFGFALIAGFIAAYPVNYIMIKKKIKQCH